MKPWRIEVALSVLILSFVLIAAHRWRRSVAATPAAAASVEAAREPGPVLSAAHIEEGALVATEQDPFRLSRKPADVPFTGRRAAAAAPPPPSEPPFRGPLVLKGIVGGPPWRAVIDGLPGQPPGTVVSAGSTFEKLVIRAVSRDSVVVQAPDTVWHLTLLKGNQ